MVKDDDRIIVPTEDDDAKFSPPQPGKEAIPPSSGEESIDALRQELAECRDKLLRAQAECANISKRLHQQHAESMKMASMGLAREVLNVVDSFERSVESLEAAGAERSVVDGVRLIAQQLSKALHDHGIEPIDAAGKPFDPTHHEALMSDYDSELPPGTVTSELVRGYTMHGRVLRPSRVTVAAEKPAESNASANAGDDRH